MFSQPLFLTCALLAMSASTGHATPINAAPTGLASPDHVVGFGEVALANNTVVTTQYQAFGVIIAPAVTYQTTVSPRENFTNPAALNFGRFGFADPLSIQFTTAVSGASFAMTANNSPSAIFTARLGGAVVESFTGSLADGRQNGTLWSTPTRTDPNNIYGFTGIVFDEITIDIQSNAPFGALDTISYNLAAVPLPASLPLLLAAIGGMAMIRRKRSR